MRSMIVAFPLILASTPVAAAAPQAAPQLPSELTDPAMAEQMGKMAGALTRALMKMPVGEIEAAVQGREATAAEKAKTVGDVVGGPAAADQVEAKAAQSGRAMQAGMKAMMKAMPAIMAALDGVEADLTRATANLPDPTYPKR